MTGRAVQRALRQHEAKLLRSADPEIPCESSESDREIQTTSAKPSLFAILGDVEDADVGVDDEAEENDEAEAVEVEQQSPSQTSKKAKKKKRKNKSKGKAQVEKKQENTNQEDDIDRALRQLNIADSTPLSSTPGNSDSAADPLSSVLRIDTRNLDADNEMKKLFGKHALQLDSGDSGTPGRRRVGGRIPTATGGLAGGRRKNTFVQAKENWPNAPSGGLGMEIEFSDQTTDVTVFRFVHSLAYQDVQRQFSMCVASMDPNRMITLLQHNPYHITTLIQSSEIFNHQRDFSVAGDLLERALFSMGRSLHSTFAQKLASGTARLSFARPENRELFLCCWKYIKNLIQRGTWRTADEFARLMLALDLEGDPYEICLLIDFLSLKGCQPKRFLSLVEHPQLRNKYSDLPNIAFSSALAYHQLGNESAAMEYLLKAITKFPWMPSLLYKELSIDTDLPPVLWAAQLPQDNLRQCILSRLYIDRAIDLWKDPTALKLLVDTASLIHTLPRKPLLSNASQEVTLPLGRHILLTDIPAITALLPRTITITDTSSFDPLPPENNLICYSAEVEIPEVLSARETEFQQLGEDEGVLRAFLRSILPWYRTSHANGGSATDGGLLTEEERMDRLIVDMRALGLNVDHHMLVQEAEEEERRQALEEESRD